MRHSLAALALVAAVTVGLVAPATPVAQAAATDGAKVVIVVGATHGTTSRYRDYANAAYAEAIKYTSNVVKVYSPNATWAKVKEAAVGASILIYFGHGNGWPSPYTYDPNYVTKNGMGLNATAGNGDHNNKYYGEPYMAQLDLAPNAIVLLHHLCYAAGNGEPGQAEPTRSVARQRVDNYGAGFLKSKARLVLADGHRGPVEYLRSIFTTDQTMEQLWRTASNAKGNFATYASSRTAGATYMMDPNTPTSGYYRSIVGDPNLTTKEIVRGFSVPGRAAAKTAGTPVYDAPPPAIGTSTLTPTSTLAAATRLKVVELVSGTGDNAVYRIEGLDDASISGYAIARDMDPKDSVAPRVMTMGGASGSYSTRETGGTHRLYGSFNESATWTVSIKHGSTEVARQAGQGKDFAVTIDPAAASVGDGRYDYEITGIDGWKNGPSSKTGWFLIDTVGPDGTVQIDGGEATAMVGTVRVGLTATDTLSSVAKVRLSNTHKVDGSGLLSAGTTFAAAPSIAWTLAVGKGDRAVYAQWQDSAGNWSAVRSDSIKVDPPNATYNKLDTPTRILDTRHNLPSKAVKLTSDQPYRFKVANANGIPSGAIAITANLTVVGQTAAGYLTLGPVVGPNPATSTLNFPKSDVRANGVVVPLDRTGWLEVVYKGAAGSKADAVLDVTGYFVAGDGGSRYISAAPARFLDTRVVGDVTSGLPLANGAPLAVQIGDRTVGAVAIPADAVAVTGNLTVAGQTAAGYLSITPTAQSAPSTSTLNFPKSDVRANNVTVPLGDGGKVWIVYKGSGTAHAILDITGYYRKGSDGLRWVPLAPARVLDSRIDLGRSGAFKESVPGSVTVVGKGGIGGDAVALTGNLTVVGQTKQGYTSLTPSPVADPSTSTLNFPVGEARANGVGSRVNVSDGKVSLTYKATSGATTHLVMDITGYYH